MAKRDKKEQKIYDEYVKDLKKHESYREDVYPDGKDSEGRQLYSVGYGHQLTQDELLMYPPGSKVSKKVTDDWFKRDAERYYELGKAEAAKYNRTDAGSIKGFSNAMYNLGEGGFAGFKNMREAMENNRWGEVAGHAKDSKWYREDAPTRTQYFIDNVVTPHPNGQGTKVQSQTKTQPVEQPVIPNGAIQENPVVEKTMPKKEESWIGGQLAGLGDTVSDIATKASNTGKSKEELMKELEAAYASGDTEAVTKAMALMGDNKEYQANLDKIDASMNEALMSKDALYDENGNLIGKGKEVFSKEPIDAATKVVEDTIVDENQYGLDDVVDGVKSSWKGDLGNAMRNVIKAKMENKPEAARSANFSGSVKADLAGLAGVLNARKMQFTPYMNKFGG